MQAPPNRQNYNHKPVIVAGTMPALARCTQKSGGVDSYTQELSFCRCVVCPARGSALATDTQYYRTKPILQRAEISTSNLPHPINLLPPFVKQRHFWSSPGHRLHSLSEDTSFSNALSQARQAQFWSCLDLSQTYLVADLGQAPTPRCADAPGQQISVIANVLAEHEFVQAVSDSFSFLSVNKDQPPIQLLLHFVLSRSYAHVAVIANNFWAPAQAPLSRAPHSVFVRARAISALDALLGLVPAASRAQTPARSPLCQLR